MPRQLTVVESIQKLLVDAGYMKEGDDTRNGVWGQYTKEAYEKAVWEIAYARRMWTHQNCVSAAMHTPEQVPPDLAKALRDIAKENEADEEEPLQERFQKLNENEAVEEETDEGEPDESE